MKDKPMTHPILERANQVQELLNDNFFFDNPNGSDIRDELQPLIDSVKTLVRALEVSEGALKIACYCHQSKKHGGICTPCFALAQVQKIMEVGK
jgi:hypothetical protein